MISIDSLRGGCSDALEQFSGSRLILDLLFEEIGEAGNTFNLLSPTQQLYNTDDGSHNVLSFVVCGYIRHVLLKLYCERVKKGLNLADNHNGRPLD